MNCQCPVFRVLVAGRSDAGKTTILKKICSSTDDPIIHDRCGNQIDSAVVTTFEEHEAHNIENELRFKSNPEFIFHESRGFESGSDDEVKILQAFIKTRGESTDMTKRLHAIWYCVPTNTDRPTFEMDEKFFQQCYTGKVPVIVIFTKFDSLVTTAYGQLRSTGTTIKEAKKQAPDSAKGLLENFITPFNDIKFPPKKLLYLQDMQKESADCSELMKTTVDVINDTLKNLGATDNVDLCVYQAIEQADLDLGTQSL